MITQISKELCTGCAACAAICPKQIIEMSEDKEGFFYPTVNMNECIGCNKCVKICPIENNQVQCERYYSPLILAAQSQNVNIRKDSTSGGIFSELAMSVLKDEGFVVGAVYEDDWSVKHIITDDIHKLEEIRSSKYIQSSMWKAYKEIIKVVSQEKKVFICGTPCQIAGLYNVLGKDYENLVTADFICAGVNSPKVFRKYIKMLEKKYNSKVIKVKFKNKKYGWHNFSTKIDFENKKVYIKDRYTDKFMRGYLEYNCFLRKACYNCMFLKYPHLADITLGDFWGIENVKKEIDDDLGTSVIMLNSRKGEVMFKSADNIKSIRCRVKDVVPENRCLIFPNSMHIHREQFFAELDELPFEAVLEKNIPSNNLNRKLKLGINRTKKLIRKRKTRKVWE